MKPIAPRGRPPTGNVGGKLTVLGGNYDLWLSRPIRQNGKPKSWEFATDARGRRCVNIQVELAEPEKRNAPSLGIDLGLNSGVALSNGFKIAAPRFYRQQKTTRRVATARADGSRKGAGEENRQQASAFPPRGVARSRAALRGDRRRRREREEAGQDTDGEPDAGWSMLSNLLSYKSIATGGVMRVVPERYSCQTRSVCGCIPASSPKGLGALGVRQWRCDGCGTLHDRDINGARNIEIAGAEPRPPVAEIPALQGGEDVELRIRRSAKTKPG